MLWLFKIKKAVMKKCGDLYKWTREAAASAIFLMTIIRAVKIGVQ